MSTTIRTKEPRDLLALIPYQLGFQPRRSAVLVSIRARRSRVGLVARVDLAALADGTDGPPLARSLVAHMAADGAQRVVLVLYTDEDPRRDGTSPAMRAHGHLAAAGLPGAALDSWVVGPQGWFGLSCADSRCCPPGGRPLQELQSATVSAEMVLRGARVAACREELGRVEPAGVDARRAARRAADRWDARLLAADGATAMHRWRRDGLRLWRAEVERSATAAFGEAGPALSCPATVLGRLCSALGDVLVRDAVLLSLVPGTEEVANRVVAGDAGPEIGVALRAIVDPQVGVPPDPVGSAAARSVLQQVVAHAPVPRRAPGLTLLAVLAWWEGDGARAGVLLEQALAAAPEYRLAVLVSEALSRGMAPGWLRGSGAP